MMPRDLTTRLRSEHGCKLKIIMSSFLLLVCDHLQIHLLICRYVIKVPKSTNMHSGLNLPSKKGEEKNVYIKNYTRSASTWITKEHTRCCKPVKMLAQDVEEPTK